MSKIIIYAKVFGLAENEDGSPAYAGMRCELGEFVKGKEIPYDKLISNIDKKAFLKMCCIEDIIDIDSIEFITPDEYLRDYADDDETDDPIPTEENWRDEIKKLDWGEEW
jgi:hypothetical protein